MLSSNLSSESNIMLSTSRVLPPSPIAPFSRVSFLGQKSSRIRFKALLDTPVSLTRAVVLLMFEIFRSPNMMT
jgi:hypothetical protein